MPDLRVLPAQHPAIENIWIGAGPVPETLHRMLNLLATARAAFGLPSLSALAPLFHRVLSLMHLGEYRGGMFVHARGHRDGQPAERSWHLLAEGDDGPYIPSMAAEAILRKHLAGRPPASGARPATGALTLGDYDDLFRNRDIHTGVRDHADTGWPLYRRVLDAAFNELPPSVRALHDAAAASRWSGVARVGRGRDPLARLAARLIGFPAETDAVSVTVDFARKDGAEIWSRNFGGALFQSVQSQGRGRDAHLLLERFGPITVALALVVEHGRLRLVPRNWRLLGIPLPRALLPGGETFECEEDGKFTFDVTIRAPLCGLIVAYRGQLSPVPEAALPDEERAAPDGRPRKCA